MHGGSGRHDEFSSKIEAEANYPCKMHMQGELFHRIQHGIKLPLEKEGEKIEEERKEESLLSYTQRKKHLAVEPNSLTEELNAPEP